MQIRALQFCLNGTVRNSLCFAELWKFTADNTFVKFLKTTLSRSILNTIKMEIEPPTQTGFI